MTHEKRRPGARAHTSRVSSFDDQREGRIDRLQGELAVALAALADAEAVVLEAGDALTAANAREARTAVDDAAEAVTKLEQTIAQTAGADTTVSVHR
ncbi:hypothetical protein [Agromyces humi]|uniref:hypothetical protein n=1 Tax=Agromyces humi TaxID=1766800 RepID=UPI00135C8AFF|nr:hypothetical protein [Agromyces humi]